MVSFSCENCGDVLTKKKLDPHRNQCRGASYTCIDCMVHFTGTDYRAHTSCISEAQKYQGSLYKEKKAKPDSHKHTNGTTASERIKNNNDDESSSSSTALVSRKTIVQETSYTSSALAIVDAPPEAPEPPPNVNVFDFLVGPGAEEDDDWESDRDDDDDMRPEPTPSFSKHYAANGYAYGTHPISARDERHDSFADLRDSRNGSFVTPAPRKGHSRNISTDSTAKKSGKRKRGHPEGLDLSKTDIVMTEAPPSMLHSGLTGGMTRLLGVTRAAFPPSPELSTSPQSPLKRSKHDRDGHKTKKSRRKSSSSDEKAKKRAKDDSKKHERSSKHVMERRRSRKRSASPAASSGSPSTHQPKKQLKIEYPGHTSAPDMSKALIKVEHAPTTRSVDMFLTCLARGSETDEGVSLYRALKRWRREGGEGEKELWKRLKVRANEEGDLVICV